MSFLLFILYYIICTIILFLILFMIYKFIIKRKIFNISNIAEKEILKYFEEESDKE